MVWSSARYLAISSLVFVFSRSRDRRLTWSLRLLTFIERLDCFILSVFSVTWYSATLFLLLISLICSTFCFFSRVFSPPITWSQRVTFFCMFDNSVWRVFSFSSELVLRVLYTDYRNLSFSSDFFRFLKCKEFLNFCFLTCFFNVFWVFVSLDIFSFRDWTKASLLRSNFSNYYCFCRSVSSYYSNLFVPVFNYYSNFCFSLYSYLTCFYKLFSWLFPLITSFLFFLSSLSYESYYAYKISNFLVSSSFSYCNNWSCFSLDRAFYFLTFFSLIYNSLSCVRALPSLELVIRRVIFDRLRDLAAAFSSSFSFYLSL